jgi:hypothetical protein
LTVAREHAGELLEREAELAAIADLVDRGSGGVGGVLLVEGEAGVGKTSLLQAVEQVARDQPMRVLVACGGELERSFPFGVAAQLFAPAVPVLDPTQRGSLMSGAAALASTIVDPGAGVALSSSSSGEPLFARLHGLYWLCAGLAISQPLVLVVDDAHWADEPSLQWLLFMARRLGDVLAADHPRRPANERHAPPRWWRRAGALGRTDRYPLSCSRELGCRHGFVTARVRERQRDARGTAAALMLATSRAPG